MTWSDRTRLDACIVVMDFDWRTIWAGINGNFPPGGGLAPGVTARHTERGWTVEDLRRPTLDACLDVSISCSPTTMSLPVRRLDWHVGQTRNFHMVHMMADNLQVRLQKHRYTCLAERRFLFAVADGSVSAEIDFDEMGLVMDFPPLFQRA